MKFANRVVLAAAAVLLSCAAFAATITYTYDPLGRLQQVITSDGRLTVYTLDAAGNRVSVEDAVAPGTPSSLSVPSSSSTGSYTVSWGTSTGTVSVYELYESASPSFSSSSRVFVGPGTSAAISGRGNGTFYYEVRACKDSACSDYRTGANPIVVSIPIPAPPTNAVASQIADCAWRASWNASSGATLYKVGDTTGDEQQTTALSVNVTCPVGNPNANKPKWVQACSAGGCSVKVDFFPPGAPSSISVPSSSANGAYTIAWGTASGTVTAYELYESTSSTFASQTLAYSGTGTTNAFSGKGEGNYYYRVRACNGSTCSSYTVGSGPVAVLFAPGVPSSISVPSSSSTGSYTISWGTASGTVGSYELYESASPSFGSSSQVFVGAGTSAVITGHGNGTFYYEVRACNGSGCSGYRTGANPIVVSVPIPAPPTNAVASQIADCAWRASWDAASGATLYKVGDTTGNEQQTTALSVNITCPVGNPNANKPKWVQACSAGGCSVKVDFFPTPPGLPSSISVPSSSTNGAYTITWGTASGTVTAYELYESTSSTFASQTLAYSGTGTTNAFSGKGEGNYYYRVRACNGSACSGYTAGAGPVAVLFAPGVPSSISVPSSSTTGGYTVSWGTASGAVSSYELYESTSPSFPSQTLVFSGGATAAGLSGRTDGGYYYRVRACNSSGCGGYQTGANGVSVSLAPSAPSSISVPSLSPNGNYTISWGGSSGVVTAYELYESRNSFSTQTLVFSGTSTGVTLSGRATGTYYYRVRACNGSLCSVYTTGSNSLLVKLPADIPASITVPATSTTGLYQITWGLPTEIVEWYELYEATNASFSGETLVLSALQQFYNAPSVRPDGAVFYYRVRACNSSGCGPLLAGSNPVVVSIPPPPPSPPTGLLSRQVADCAWTASWNASSGATSYNFGTTNGSEQTTTALSVTISCPLHNPNANKPKWVQACSANGCSVKANF